MNFVNGWWEIPYSDNLTAQSEWCNTVITDNWKFRPGSSVINKRYGKQITAAWLFRNERDAVMFVLRWS